MKVRYLLSLATVATLGLGLVSCAAPEAPADEPETEEMAPEEGEATDAGEEMEEDEAMTGEEPMEGDAEATEGGEEGETEE